MNKNELEICIKKWALEHLLSRNYEVVKIYEKENISKINSNYLKFIYNSGLCDFICDFTIILKSHKKYEICLINRMTKSIGLRDVGEMLTYSRICNPEFSFLISSRGFSSEISTLLSNKENIKKLLTYFDKSIIGFQMLNDGPKPDSVLPVSYRKNL